MTDLILRAGHQPDWIYALLGGGLIGLSVSIMLFFNGRVTGISGILGGALVPSRGDTLWRVLFIGGLILGGLIMTATNLDVFSDGKMVASSPVLILAGVLVGFGTVLGSGCTSGHGVCGVSRLSVRSIVATGAFMLSGVLVVMLVRHLLSITY